MVKASQEEVMSRTNSECKMLWAKSIPEQRERYAQGKYKRLIQLQERAFIRLVPRGRARAQYSWVRQSSNFAKHVRYADLPQTSPNVFCGMLCVPWGTVIRGDKAKSLGIIPLNNIKAVSLLKDFSSIRRSTLIRTLISIISY